MCFQFVRQKLQKLVFWNSVRNVYFCLVAGTAENVALFAQIFKDSPHLLFFFNFSFERLWIVSTISSVKTKYLRNFSAAQTNFVLTFFFSLLFFVWYVWILNKLEHSFLHDLEDSSDSSTRVQWIELPDICSIQWNGSGTWSQAAEKSSNFRIFY